MSKTIGGSKNGGKREVGPKSPKFYPADDVPVKAPSAREAASKGVAKLRKSIKPGTVLILLAGRFRGRRVVFLKQLPSGLLLVTGPYTVNGVPMRRVNQTYVIATSTTVDIKGVKADKFTDAYFAKKKVPKSQKKKGDVFAADAEVHNARTAHYAPSSLPYMPSLPPRASVRRRALPRALPSRHAPRRRRPPQHGAAPTQRASRPCFAVRRAMLRACAAGRVPP